MLSWNIERLSSDRIGYPSPPPWPPPRMVGWTIYTVGPGGGGGDFPTLWRLRIPRTLSPLSAFGQRSFSIRPLKAGFQELYFARLRSDERLFQAGEAMGRFRRGSLCLCPLPPL